MANEPNVIPRNKHCEIDTGAPKFGAQRVDLESTPPKEPPEGEGSQDKEVFPGQDPKAPMIFAPTVCYGAEQLGQTLRNNALSFPASFVVELSQLAVRIQKFLGEAEPRLRGPG